MITEKGYLMKDGTVVAFGTGMQGLSPRHIKELSDSPSNQWDGFLIHNSILDMEKKVDTLVLSIDTRHLESCPINSDRVLELVKTEIEGEPKKKYKQVKGVFKEAIFWLMFVVMVATALQVFQ